MEANKTTNITRISSLEEAKVLHIEDSLSACDEIALAPQGRLVDIGSGAGFPGIPLAIETKRDVLLVESIKKKAAILESMTQTLGLDETTSVYSGRVEELAKERPGSFAVATARAVAKLSVLMELASPLLIQGGKLVCYKAHVNEEEMQHAKSLESRLALYHESTREFLLSDGETFRSIIVFVKKGQPKLKLPRNIGMAQKKPL